jgi:hypothetical protein
VLERRTELAARSVRGDVQDQEVAAIAKMASAKISSREVSTALEGARQAQEARSHAGRVAWRQADKAALWPRSPVLL